MGLPDLTTESESAVITSKIAGSVEHLPSRADDPDESWAAGLAITGAQRAGVREQVLQIIHERGPLTADALFDEYQQRGGKRLPQRVRTACAELGRLGMLERRGGAHGSVSAAGNAAALWALTARAQDELLRSRS